MSEDIKKVAKEYSQHLKGAHIKWDHASMQTTYANVVNVASTMEELSVFFGTNKTWDLDEEVEVIVELTHRILLNPYAAKRLSILLSYVIGEYESRFGPLGLEERKHTMH